MGIQVEFNPDLALRNIGQFQSGEKKEAECIPEPLEVGNVYTFLKKGQRNYWLEGELPLLETKGNGELSLPVASIVILEVTHSVIDGELWTSGKYRVVELISDGEVKFNGFAKTN
jgi:hypothetical protein